MLNISLFAYFNVSLYQWKNSTSYNSSAASALQPRFAFYAYGYTCPATFTAQNDIKYGVDATSVGNKKVAQTVKICSEISMKRAEILFGSAICKF